MIRTKLILLSILLAYTVAFAQPTAEEAARQAAITEFTKKQQAANWPEKFARIGNEMGVPPDVLAAVAFAETRWEHLQWPEGETVSSATGIPRGYGVMFLQDNNYFGHSLTEAAKLIGKTPDELKADPELNIRGAAALLKKLYDENPKPDFAKPEQVESWYNAVIKYCGIPEPFLSHQHALNCYVYMNKGYDQFGMHWQPHPVDVTAMRADVTKLREQFDAAIKQKQATNVVADTVEPPTNVVAKVTPTNVVTPQPAKAVVATQPVANEPKFPLPIFVGIALGIVFALFLRMRRKKN